MNKKIILTTVALILVLALGMVFASCNDTDVDVDPTDPADTTTEAPDVNDGTTAGDVTDDVTEVTTDDYVEETEPGLQLATDLSDSGWSEVHPFN